MRKLLYLMIVMMMATAVSSQNNPYDYVQETPFLTNKEFSLGLTLHSHGFGLNFRKGENLTVDKKRLYEVEFVSMKHPKEYKTVSYRAEKPKTFIFGKMNALLVGHGGYRMEKILFTKTEPSTFEIRLHATAGPSFGFTKPVYLVFAINNPPGEQRVVAKYDPNNPNHDLENIYGKAEFTKGFDEIKVYPGLYLKTGAMFEYDPLNDGITAVEVGMMLDAYGKKIPIMAFARNKQWWFNFYITVLFGRKS